MDEQEVIAATREWIASVVIGLNLCPFAERVFQAGLIRYVVSAAEDEKALLDDLATELKHLAATAVSSVETTLLLHPRVLRDFLAYNDFLDDADHLVEELGLTGTIQIASFHPDYQFAGTAPDAVENYTNRSPCPMLHLLREESITNLAADADDLLDIPRRNIETLRSLPEEAVRKLRMGVRGP